MAPSKSVRNTPVSRSWLYPTTIPLVLFAFACTQLQNVSLLEKLTTTFSLSRQPFAVDTPAIDTPEYFESIRHKYAAKCPDHVFRTHLFSTDPLVMYLENFFTYDETRYILELAKPFYSQSAFGRGMDTSKQYDSSIRSSQSAILPADPVVECLEHRSLDFQGFLPSSQIENLQTVRYKVGDLFRPHYDWASTYEENPRFSTIFGYLLCDDCVGGATQFPNIEGKFSGKWCKFMDCGESPDGAEVGGVGFKPIVGNAVFWVHHYPNGTGHPGVLHAGMPVRNGTKVGMNIMTRQKPNYS